MRVGDVVTLKVRNPIFKFKHVYASYVDVPEFHVYTGKLVAPGRGDPAGTVRITSGDPKYPVRLIEIDHIEDADAATDPAPNQESWSVVGSKGSKYQIVRDGGHYSCSCPGFDFRKRCRHIEELRAKAA
jgi:hypothetical protein